MIATVEESQVAGTMAEPREVDVTGVSTSKPLPRDGKKSLGKN